MPSARFGFLGQRKGPPSARERYEAFLRDRARNASMIGAMANNAARAFNSIQPLGNPNAGRTNSGGGVNSPGGGGDGVGGGFNDPGFTALPSNPPPVRGGTNLIQYFDQLNGGGPLTPSGLPSRAPGSSPQPVMGGSARGGGGGPATSSNTSVRNTARRPAANGGNTGVRGSSVFK